MGHHLVGSEGEGAQEIELGHDAKQFGVFLDRKRVEIVLFKHGLQFAQCDLAGNAHHIRSHILADRILEEAIHHFTWKIAWQLRSLIDIPTDNGDVGIARIG